MDGSGQMDGFSLAMYRLSIYKWNAAVIEENKQNKSEINGFY